jgi:hypothetical protein
MGFIGLVVNLPDQQMAPRSASEKVRPKNSNFSSACEYVKLPFSLRTPKNTFQFVVIYCDSFSVPISDSNVFVSFNLIAAMASLNSLSTLFAEVPGPCVQCIFEYKFIVLQSSYIISFTMDSTVNVNIQCGGVQN